MRKNGNAKDKGREMGEQSFVWKENNPETLEALFCIPQEGGLTLKRSYRSVSFSSVSGPTQYITPWLHRRPRL